MKNDNGKGTQVKTVLKSLKAVVCCLVVAAFCGGLRAAEANGGDGAALARPSHRVVKDKYNADILLYVEGCSLRDLVDEIALSDVEGHKALTTATFYLCALPNSLRSFLLFYPKLKHLHLNNCGVKDIAPAGLFFFLEDLETCDLAGNEIARVPDLAFLRCYKLKVLDLSENKIADLSKLQVAHDLHYFSCAYNPGLDALPADFSKLSAKVYNIAGCPKLNSSSFSTVGNKSDHEFNWGVMVIGMEDGLHMIEAPSFIEGASPAGIMSALGSGAAKLSHLMGFKVGVRLPSLSVLWAPASGVSVPGVSASAAPKHPDLRYAVTAPATADANWYAAERDWQDRFSYLLKKQARRVVEKNQDIFCSMSDGGGIFGNTAMADVLSGMRISLEGVKGFLKEAHDRKKTAVPAAQKTQVALRSLVSDEYAKSAYVLTKLFASTEKKVKALLAYCSYVAKRKGVTTTDSIGIHGVLTAFCGGRSMDLAAADTAILDNLFPYDEDRCPTAEYKEHVMVIRPAAYNAWDHMYVFHAMLRDVFRALLQRLFELKPREWAFNDEFTTAEKATRKIARPDKEWPDTWSNTFEAIDIIVDLLHKDMTNLNTNGDLFDLTPSQMAYASELKTILEDLEACKKLTASLKPVPPAPADGEVEEEKKEEVGDGDE